MSRRTTTTGLRQPGASTVSRTASSASLAMPPPSRVPSHSARPASSASASASASAEAGSSRPTSPKKPARKPTVAGGSSKGDAGEINIQVVVRLRGRSPQELATMSPLITTTSGAVSKQISIETTPLPTSSLSTFTTASAYGGSSHAPTSKTYPFDKVFGPEADNTTVFNEVAEDMLREVLAGYNCTIFAYGQTGTGKTYTMQGDLELTNLSAPKMEAGIVPRALHRLFSLLHAAENTEFSVKCSYVELYNEELRDLLSTEYAGSDKHQQQQQPGGLRLYEDGKKGVLIQGLEECAARNLKEALAIVNKGVQRRQVAETKMNTESSRSHTIFSITVHVKETSVTGGEDMMRIGKFNLVDLAGSEAIGRSGASDKRAREAGMINQSLLTLGRVISALVEKDSRIPYRDSKLTRLLQDSLGGRTKTCIVATVSPTRSNMEETLSTLDYAIRAKSIRNRPEINAHLTKAGLLKEYMGDIDRLKGELMAAREKNGIYIPEEQWKEMHDTQAKMKSEYDEAVMRANAITVELNSRKREFDEISTKFLATVDDLASAREAERQLGILIEEAKADLETARIQLEEEVVVSEAYQAGEQRIGRVADGLKQVATESVADVGGLFEKLARKAQVLGSNADAATRFGTGIDSLSTDLRKGLKQLHHLQHEFGKSLKTDLNDLTRQRRDLSQQDLVSIDTALATFNTSAESLTTSIQRGETDAAEAGRALLAAKDSVQQIVRDWSRNVSERSTQMVDDVIEHQSSHLSVVSSVLGSTADLIDSVIRSTRQHLAAEAEAAEHSKQLAHQTAAAEIMRLRTQNESLAKMLMDERAKSAKLRTELVSSLTSLIHGFTDAQDESWNTAVESVKQANHVGMEQMERYGDQVEQDYMDRTRRADAVEGDLQGAESNTKRQRTDGQHALGEVTAGVRSRLELFGQQTRDQAAQHVQQVDGFCGQLDEVSSDVARKATLTAQAQSQEVEAMEQAVSTTMQNLKTRSSQSVLDQESATSRVLSAYSTSSERFDSTYAESSKNVKSVLAATSTFLSTGIHEDVPTGITPKKKSWNVPASWERTEPREALLEAFRQKKAAAGSGVDSSSPTSSVADDVLEAEAETAEVASAPIPTVHSSDSLVSTASTLSTGPVSRLKGPVSVVGKSLGADGVAVGKKAVVVPLGENGGNIPVPRRVRK